MERVIVQAVSEHLCINMCAARARMLEFLDNERRAAFAHYESIPQRIKWATSQNRVACPSSHRFNNVEGTNRDSRQRRFRSAGHNYVYKIVADITKCFADRDCATGATV